MLMGKVTINRSFIRSFLIYDLQELVIYTIRNPHGSHKGSWIAMLTVAPPDVLTSVQRHTICFHLFLPLTGSDSADS